MGFSSVGSRSPGSNRIAPLRFNWTLCLEDCRWPQGFGGTWRIHQSNWEFLTHRESREEGDYLIIWLDVLYLKAPLKHEAQDTIVFISAAARNHQCDSKGASLCVSLALFHLSHDTSASEMADIDSPLILYVINFTTCSDRLHQWSHRGPSRFNGCFSSAINWETLYNEDF